MKVMGQKRACDVLTAEQNRRECSLRVHDASVSTPLGSMTLTRGMPLGSRSFVLHTAAHSLLTLSLTSSWTFHDPIDVPAARGARLAWRPRCQKHARHS